MTTSYTTHFRFAMPDFRMGPWHDLVNDNMGQIDDLIYGVVSNSNVLPWTNNTVYSVGTTVLDSDLGTTWMCNVANNSASTGTFAAQRTAQPTWWVQLIAGFAPRGEWAHNTNYFPYDLAYQSSLGVFAQCKTSHVSNAAGTILDDASNWNFIFNLSSSVIAATSLTFSTDSQGITFSRGGKMFDQNTAGTGGLGRTLIEANNDSFDLLKEDGSAAIFTARYGDTSPLFKLDPILHSGTMSLTSAQQLQARKNIGFTTATRTVSTNDTLLQSDFGKMIYCTPGSNITIGVTAAATLGDGWWCSIINIGAGIITIDPNGSETIDAVTTAKIYTNERMRIWTNGSAFTTFDHAGDWVSYTPTLSASGGGTPTAAVVVGRYKKVRTSVMVEQFVQTLGGTGVNFLAVGLPIVASASAVGALAGQETAVNGKSFTGQISGGFSTAQYRYADATATASTIGANYYASGIYEVAP